MIGLLVAAVLSRPASAREPLAPAYEAALQAAALQLSPQAVPLAPDPKTGSDAAAPLLSGQLRLSGPFGVFRSAPLGRPQSEAPAPLNAGFKALGRAGKTGKIDGPGRKGNGTYRVETNDTFEVAIKLATGYVDGRMTLKRDPAGAGDTMRFEGRLWDNDRGAWGDPVDNTSSVAVTYDAKKDSGLIRWQENGRWKEEGYWGGKEGNTSMTIEVGGGWDHDFEQD